MPVDSLLRLEDRRARLLEVVEHPLAESEECRSRRGYPDLAPQPEKQLLVQLLLEQEDLTAHRRLREVQLLARTRERTALRHRPQNLELSKIHAVFSPVRGRTPANAGAR